MKNQIAKNEYLTQIWIRPNMVLERRGDCSLILDRVYGGEREKRRREEEEEGRKKNRKRRNLGMELLGSLEVWKFGIHVRKFGIHVWKFLIHIWNTCLEHLFCLELLDLLVRNPP